MRLSLQTRLVGLYLESQKYHDALQLSTTLLRELRRLDDKMVLVEVQLLESRVYHALRNIPKSRASLTSARTAANAIYCPPIVQAGLDMQSGILLAEDKDFKTAYTPGEALLMIGIRIFMRRWKDIIRKTTQRRLWH